MVVVFDCKDIKEILKIKFMVIMKKIFLNGMSIVFFLDYIDYLNKYC